MIFVCKYSDSSIGPDRKGYPLNVFSHYKKHAYSNILNILQPKSGKNSDKKIIFFIFLLQTYIVGTR